MLEAGRQIIEAAESGTLLSEGDIKFGDEWKNRPSEANSVMVGDRNVDMEAAKSFGVRSFKCDPNKGLNEVISEILVKENE